MKNGTLKITLNIPLNVSGITRTFENYIYTTIITQIIKGNFYRGSLYCEFSIVG